MVQYSYRQNKQIKIHKLKVNLYFRKRTALKTKAEEYNCSATYENSKIADLNIEVDVYRAKHNSYGFKHFGKSCSL